MEGLIWGEGGFEIGQAILTGENGDPNVSVVDGVRSFALSAGNVVGGERLLRKVHGCFQILHVWSLRNFWLFFLND